MNLLDERSKNNNWRKAIDFESNWFGDPALGFRYHRINLDLFRNKMHMNIEGTFGFYLEIPGSKLSTKVESDMLDLFVDEFCSNRTLVHKREWRYPVMGYGVDASNEPYYSILITFDLIDNVYPEGKNTTITNKEHNWFGNSEEGFRYTIMDADLFNKLYPKLPTFEDDVYAIYVEIDDLFCPEELRDILFDEFVERVIDQRLDKLTHNPEERYLIFDENYNNNGELGFREYQRCDRSYLFIFRNN